jgi:urease accessory protein UreF
MAVLQYGDSFFPSGSACFSWGTEFLSENAILTTADDVKSFVRGQLYARWAKFDRPVVIAAHKANLDLGAVSAVDNRSTFKRHRQNFVRDHADWAGQC